MAGFRPDDGLFLRRPFPPCSCSCRKCTNRICKCQIIRMENSRIGKAPAGEGAYAPGEVHAFCRKSLLCGDVMLKWLRSLSLAQICAICEKSALSAECELAHTYMFCQRGKPRVADAADFPPISQIMPAEKPLISIIHDITTQNRSLPGHTPAHSSRA